MAFFFCVPGQMNLLMVLKYYCCSPRQFAVSGVGILFLTVSPSIFCGAEAIQSTLRRNSYVNRWKFGVSVKEVS